jgi:hypothetical protein
MDCGKYKTRKIMNNENISWIYLIVGKYFWALRVRFYLYDRSECQKTEGVYPRARLSGLLSTRAWPSYCTHLRAAGRLLAAAGAATRQSTRGWQPYVEIQESRHMTGSHARVTRLSFVHAHPESRYVYQRYPVPGLGAATPGHVILTLRAAVAGAAG